MRDTSFVQGHIIMGREQEILPRTAVSQQIVSTSLNNLQDQGILQDDISHLVKSVLVF